MQYADLAPTGPALAFAEAKTTQISDDLILGFPQREPPFAATGAFIDRFSALSTIKQLDSDSDNLAQLSARARQDEKLLENLLRVFGYYDGRVIRSIGAVETGDSDAGSRPRVRFDVIPGERYAFGAIDLGGLVAAPDGPALRQTFAIVPGDLLQSDTILAERAHLDTALGELGYPFAVIDDPQLLIDHERREGDLTMPVAPNGKYRFGGIISGDPAFLSNEHLADIARFAPGEIYRRSMEFDFRRAVLATGLVSSITLTPREVTPPQGDTPGTVADGGRTAAGQAAHHCWRRRLWHRRRVPRPGQLGTSQFLPARRAAARARNLPARRSNWAASRCGSIISVAATRS